MSTSPRRAPRRDDGSVLPLVLVLMVIAALIVVPLLSYAVSVLRANTVVSDATRQREAAEAGLRVALLDPTDLFEDCDTAAARPAPTPVAVAEQLIDEQAVTTTCAQVDIVGPGALGGAFQYPVAATATQLGQTVPDTLTGRPIASAPIGATDASWWTSTPTATNDRVWLPPLPARPMTPRTNTGYNMPAAFQCKVFLPGYYDTAVTISSGNVYFASGVYYFENDVVIKDNANVVVGYGLADLPNDCADDIQVGANITDNPGTFDIDGGGATWIFGRNGRLVVDNTNTTTSLKLRFNQRYATEANGGRVSIMSVNGDDASGNDLVIANVLSVPRSRVNNVPLPAVPVVGTDYVPTASRFTPKPRPPTAPTIVTATPRTTPVGMFTNRGALLLTWNELTGTATGGAPVDYTVTTGNAPNITTVCSGTGIIEITPGVLGCVATNVRTGSQTFRLTATNSAALAATTTLTRTVSGPALTLPTAPAAPTVSADPLDLYADAAKVMWTPLTPTQASDVPVMSYTVTVERVWEVPDPVDPLLPPTEQYDVLPGCTSTATILAPASASCVVTGLPALPLTDPSGYTYLGYRFVVTAATGVGPSAASAGSTFYTSFAGVPYEAPPAPTPDPVPANVPEPILDIKTPKAISTTISIPGYIALPAGRISVANAASRDVRLNGGILAASMSIADARAAGPESLPIGIREDIVLQRKVRLVATAGTTTVTAVVQINENGDYRVNSWVVS